MRILHLVSHLNSGGITTYLLHLLPEQKKLNSQVYVWGARGERLADLQAISEEVFETVPYCKSELSPRLWASLAGLISVLKENSIDIMHAHTRVTQVLAEVASILTGIPYVTTAHGFYKRRLGRRLFPCWGKEIFAISRSVRDGLMNTFSVKQLPYIEVVPNGIDLEALQGKLSDQNRMQLRKDYGFTEQDLVILSLSRLRPSKGIHILVSAFAEASKVAKNLKLLIAGGGDETYREELEEQIDGLGLSSAVRLIGNTFEIEKPLAAADIFVAPYLSPEGFGLSILEAMAASLPIVASRIDGIIELLDGGKRGILCEEKDISGFTSAILKYAQDPKLRQAMAGESKRASEDYSSAKMAEMIHNGYEKVIRGL